MKENLEFLFVYISGLIKPLPMEKEKGAQFYGREKIYRDQLVTLGDLQEFKDDLLLSIKTIILGNSSQPAKKWLKTYEVRKLLDISPGTLQTLRNNGTLPHTKIGGLVYYDQDDINRLMAGRKKGNISKENIR